MEDRHQSVRVTIRPYQDSDYSVIAPWFSALAQFYDGHSDQNKLIDQLVGRSQKDKTGFFTLRKELWVAVTSVVVGFYCLNYKRGGAVKLGPMIVSLDCRGMGVGKAMMQDILSRVGDNRKLYATTCEENSAINTLFDSFGLYREATYPDHYKRHASEIVWGKVMKPDTFLPSSVSLVFDSQPGAVSVREFNPERDRKYLERICSHYEAWHDDLGSEFVDAIVAAWQRGNDVGVNFQDKSKWILVAEGENGHQGLAVVSPKRGGPAKLYPFAGTPEGQALLLGRVERMCAEYGCHKAYSFCSVDDTPQKRVFASNGFFERGILIQPYRSGTRLITVDRTCEGI